jgi:diguanylate cyclase (GGDEF)-like protein
MVTQANDLSVLAIDDNPDDLLLLQRKLQRLPGCHVEFTGVETLAEAEAALRAQAFDIVFMDYRLGEGNGIDGIRHLRACGFRAPMILLTGQGDERVAALSRRQGANDYIRKDDLNASLLQESIAFVLSEYRRERRDSRALKAALTDGLTGLAVKDYFLRRVEEELSRSLRYGTELACIMLDLDHFKRVNDEYGHLAGDEVLRRCAGVIRTNLRESDIAGRFGGEEFCVILPECSLFDAMAIADRIRCGIEALETQYGGCNIAVTISAGVAHAGPHALTPEELIGAADSALYVAKRAGRNRVRSATRKLQCL